MTADEATGIGHGLTCRELVDLITEYTEEALDERERTRFEAHLARCTGCRHHVGQLDATRRALRRLGGREVTERARVQLVAIFRAWRAHRGERSG